jgi:hypothetical protein
VRPATVRNPLQPIAPDQPTTKIQIMTKNFIRTILAVGLLTGLHSTFFGQGNGNIDIRFLKAKFTDTTSSKDLVAVFLVSTKDTASFPPVVNLPPKCTVFEDGREKVILLNPHMLGVTMDGDKVHEKNPPIYALIKDVIHLDSLQTSLIITYKIKGLNYNFKKMSMTPSFSEKHNKDIRVDKRCEFEVQ